MQILCFLFFFYSRAAVSVVFFHLAVLFRFYHLLFVCVVYFYLNKWGWWWWWWWTINAWNRLRLDHTSRAATPHLQRLQRYIVLTRFCWLSGTNKLCQTSRNHLHGGPHDKTCLQNHCGHDDNLLISRSKIVFLPTYSHHAPVTTA